MRGAAEAGSIFSHDRRALQQFLPNAVPGGVLGLQVPVASLSDLVRGKIWAWQDKGRRFSKRKKDELDLIRIAEAHPEMRGHIPPEIAAELEKHEE